MKFVLAGLFCSPLLLCGGPCAAQATAQPLYDYMVMDVCVDAGGRILPDRVPTDPACTRRRNLQAGEEPPYVLTTYPSKSKGCAPLVIKTNMPVVRDGVTRIVSTTNRAANTECRAAADPDEDAIAGGLSIQWLDDGYNFIMGSWSPVALSNMTTPACHANPRSSHRFFRGWVIAPLSLPGSAAPGSGVFESMNVTGKASEIGCPQRYRRGLTTWRLGQVRFTSGITLRAIVSSHYANVDAAGLGPGPALQVERTFWTAELGLSRWEKWARSDWTHPRSGRRALDLARELAATGTCGPPPADRVQINRTMTVEPAGLADVYSEKVTAEGQTHTWVMTLCSDFTNLRKEPPPPQVANARRNADRAFWTE